MVVVGLAGGLGNQMFQYAAGRALAQKRCTDLKLDVSWFRTGGRAYRLAVFNITEHLATEDEIKKLAPARRRSLAWLGKQATKLMVPGYSDPVVQEGPQALKRAQSLKHVYLAGYWQSEAYFSDIAVTLRNEFTFKGAPDAETERLLKVVENSPSVSLHVRRGDYVSDAKTNSIHGVLGLDYYERAITFVAERVTNPSFFVFSDDLPWVKSHLQLNFPITFVDHNGPEADHEDLRLMSACKHHIIANSTFSWWGAWLGQHPDKVVVAPDRWFSDERRARVPVAGLLPEGWNRL